MDIGRLEIILGAFAFVLGASIGSFLNVCIYRMPRGISVGSPRRSFCPHCNRTIPWFRNLPLVSWVALRGKCADCGVRISARYFVVELLTAALFYAVASRFWGLGMWPLIGPYWVLVALLVAATFIDFEHYIIPNEITWGGAVAGIVFSACLPMMMGASGVLGGLLKSAGAAALGYGLMWLIVEGGKRVFGRKRIKFDKPEPFVWSMEDGAAKLRVGEGDRAEELDWEETFSRPSDVLVLECRRIEFGDGGSDGSVPGEGVAGSLRFFYDGLDRDGTRVPLEKVGVISGELLAVVIPREAMGMGDVKFMAAIGAFLGLPAVFFTLVCASVIGSVMGLTLILLRKREWSQKLPFGPYLALGALAWMLCGPEIVSWYLTVLMPPPVSPG